MTASATIMPCPICEDQLLVSITTALGTLDRCPNCGWFFADQKTLSAYSADLEQFQHLIAEAQEFLLPTARLCPSGEHPMQDGRVRSRGVILTFCPLCQVFWTHLSTLDLLEKALARSLDGQLDIALSTAEANATAALEATPIEYHGLGLLFHNLSVSFHGLAQRFTATKVIPAPAPRPKAPLFITRVPKTETSPPPAAPSPTPVPSEAAAVASQGPAPVSTPSRETEKPVVEMAKPELSPEKLPEEPVRSADVPTKPQPEVMKPGIEKPFPLESSKPVTQPVEAKKLPLKEEPLPQAPEKTVVAKAKPSEPAPPEATPDRVPYKPTEVREEAEKPEAEIPEQVSPESKPSQEAAEDLLPPPPPVREAVSQLKQSLAHVAPVKKPSKPVEKKAGIFSRLMGALNPKPKPKAKVPDKGMPAATPGPAKQLLSPVEPAIAESSALPTSLSTPEQKPSPAAQVPAKKPVVLPQPKRQTSGFKALFSLLFSSLKPSPRRPAVAKPVPLPKVVSPAGAAPPVIRSNEQAENVPVVAPLVEPNLISDSPPISERKIPVIPPLHVPQEPKPEVKPELKPLPLPVPKLNVQANQKTATPMPSLKVKAPKVKKIKAPLPDRLIRWSSWVFPVVALLISGFSGYEFEWAPSLSWALVAWSLARMVRLVRLYPFLPFIEATVGSLVGASGRSEKGRPVVLKGRISQQDGKVRTIHLVDTTGSVELDRIPSWNMLARIFAVANLSQFKEEVVLQGWYRASAIPSVEVQKIAQGKATRKSVVRILRWVIAIAGLLLAITVLVTAD